MERTIAGQGRLAAALAALLIYVGASASAAAMQILDAADHGELAASIAAGGVSRIAVAGDRVKKVIRTGGGLRVEHDAASGDLYVTPAGPAEDGGGASPVRGVPLFIVTEKGFTYRLTLRPAPDGAAQILIRNPAAADGAGAAAGRDPRIAGLVALVRAVARREPLAGYAIEGGSGAPGVAGALRLIETWRGPRFAAHVVEAGGAPDAAALAGTMGAAAAWLAAPGTGPDAGRLGVVVTEHAPDPRSEAGTGRRPPAPPAFEPGGQAGEAR